MLGQCLGLLLAPEQLLDYIEGTIKNTTIEGKLATLSHKGVNHQVLNTWLYGVQDVMPRVYFLHGFSLRNASYDLFLSS